MLANSVYSFTARNRSFQIFTLIEVVGVLDDEAEIIITLCKIRTLHLEFSVICFLFISKRRCKSGRRSIFLIKSCNCYQRLYAFFVIIFPYFNGFFNLVIARVFPNSTYLSKLFRSKLVISYPATP